MENPTLQTPIMEQIALIPLPDVLQFMTSNTPMARACQVVFTHAETSGMMVHISVTLHVLTDTLMF